MKDGKGIKNRSVGFLERRFRSRREQCAGSERHFPFAAEIPCPLTRPLWLPACQVPGSIFSAKSAEKISTLRQCRHIDRQDFPRPSAMPKPEADSRSNQPRFRPIHCTGKTAAATLWQSVNAIRGRCPLIIPQPLRKLIAVCAGRAELPLSSP